MVIDLYNVGGGMRVAAEGDGSSLLLEGSDML